VELRARRGGVRAKEGRLQHTGGAGQGRIRLGRAQERRSKAGASAGLATGGGGVVVQGDGVQGDGVQACVCGYGTGGAGAELGAAACSAWWCPRWASSGRDQVGVQGGCVRCGRSCSVVAVGGSAREQRGPRVEDVGGRRGDGSGRGQAALRAARGGPGGGLAWAAAEGAALVWADHGPRGGRGSGYDAASSEGEAAQWHEAVGRAEPGVGSG
jgi:hypothetical protein